jgi:hypothetical protein
MDKYKMLTGYQYDFVKNVDANLASRMFRFDLLTQAVLSPPPTYLAQIYGLVDSRVTAAMSCCDALAATTLGWGEAARLFIIVRHINAITAGHANSTSTEVSCPSDKQIVRSLYHIKNFFNL